MKKTLIASLVAFALVGSLAPGAHAIGVYGIWWMPDDDSADDGFGAGIKEDRHITPLLSIDGRLSYISFSTPDAGIIPIEFTGLVHLGLLYGGIGVGYYFFSGDAALDNAFGWYALVGADIGLGSWGVFGELKWQALDPDIDAPSGGSANLDSFAIHVGATFGRLLN